MLASVMEVSNLSQSVIRAARLLRQPMRAGGVMLSRRAHQTPISVRRAWNCTGPPRDFRAEALRQLSETNRRLAASQPQIGTITSADQNDLFLDVTWADGQRTTRYPFIFLRDNCPCPKCIHPVAHQRMYDFVGSNLDVCIKPTSVQASGDGRLVTITWPDGHCSSYDNVWLNDHQLRHGDSHLSNIHFKVPAPKLWSAKNLSDYLPKLRLPVQDVLTDLSKTYEWLYNFKKYGFTMLTDCGTDTGMVEKIGERIGFLRRTVLGRTFIVNQTAGKLSSAEQALRSDYQYARERPMMFILHMLTEGCKMTFVDGFAAAEQLRREDPEKFKTLSTVTLQWSNRGHEPSTDVDYHLRGSHPVLTVNRDGKLLMVNYGTHGRDARLTLSPDKVHDFYRAYKRFGQLCASDEFSTPLTIQPGEAVVFDLWRLLHAQVPGQGQPAHMEGGYVDFDGFFGCLRDLHRKLKPNMEE